MSPGMAARPSSTCSSVLVWWASPFTREEGSGVMLIRDLFCCSEECSSNQIRTRHAVEYSTCHSAGENSEECTAFLHPNKGGAESGYTIIHFIIEKKN